MKPAEGERSPGCLLSPELPASLDQQASNHKCTVGQDTLVDTYAEGFPQLTRGPPILAGTNTHTRTLSWTATHLLFLQPPPYQSDQSSHACLTEPRFSFSRRRPVFLFLLPAHPCYLSGRGVRTLLSEPLPLCCVEFGLPFTGH